MLENLKTGKTSCYLYTYVQLKIAVKVLKLQSV